MSSNDLFGWDLLYKTVQSQVVHKSDILIALAHWFLIKNGTFRCVGVGDDKTVSEEDEGSELLPDGWNDSENRYALRYVFEKELYILLGAKTEGTLIINLLNVKTNNVSNVALSPETTVKSLTGSINAMVSDVTGLLDRFKKELLDPVFSGSTKEVTTQTREGTNPDPILVHLPPPRNAYEPFGIVPGAGVGPVPRRDPLRDYGRSDLDPLGRGGGGMIFQPEPLAPFGIDPSQGNFPRGARPPGARFDPFGPPDANIRPNPNRDIFRPPSEFDDMYM